MIWKFGQLTTNEFVGKLGLVSFNKTYILPIKLIEGATFRSQKIDCGKMGSHKHIKLI